MPLDSGSRDRCLALPRSSAASLRWSLGSRALVAIEGFIRTHADAMHPVTRSIIEPAGALSAADAFKGEYRLMQLRRASEAAWDQADAMLFPTAGSIYSIWEVEADPLVLELEPRLLHDCVNLVDLAAVAVPAGFRADGLPFGVTIIGPRSTDGALLDLAGTLHGALVDTLGAMPWRLPRVAAARPGPAQGFMAIAVCGAHMEGLPLNHEIRDRGGYRLRQTSTAACYRLYALRAVRLSAPAWCGQRPAVRRSRSKSGRYARPTWVPSSNPSPHLSASAASNSRTARSCRGFCARPMPSSGRRTSPLGRVARLLQPAARIPTRRVSAPVR